MPTVRLPPTAAVPLDRTCHWKTFWQCLTASDPIPLACSPSSLWKLGGLLLKKPHPETDAMLRNRSQKDMQIVSPRALQIGWGGLFWECWILPLLFSYSKAPKATSVETTSSALPSATLHSRDHTVYSVLAHVRSPAIVWLQLLLLWFCFGTCTAPRAVQTGHWSSSAPRFLTPFLSLQCLHS